MSDWTMTRRSDHCCTCGEPFAIGQNLRATLVQLGGAFERRDFCMNCETGVDEAALVGSWLTRRPEPGKPAARKLDKATLRKFFDRFADTTNESAVQLRFVLGLLLWRQRVFALERTDRVDDVERWVYREPSVSAEHVVVRPDLDEAQVERLSEQLETLLDSEGLDSEVAVAGSDDPVSSPTVEVES